MNHLGFLFAGFALAWAVAFAYVWLLSRRSSRLQERLRQIEERLERS